MKPSHKSPVCPISEMDLLINHISSFENMINKTQDFSDPVLIEEYKLFSQYIKFRTRDFHLASIKEFNQITSFHSINNL